MRILHVLDHSLPLQSGYTFRTLRIIQCQRDQGFETFHLTSPKQGSSTLEVETFDTLNFYRSKGSKFWQSLPIFRQAWTVASLKSSLEKCILELKPDVLHIHSPVLNGIAALSLAKKHHIPIVYEIRAFWEDAAVDHGTQSASSLRYKISRALESYMIKKAKHVTTICQGLKSDLLGRGLDEKKITVIPNAVDIKDFSKQKVNQSLKQSLIDTYQLKDKYIFGFIGSFYGYEGLDLFVDAIAQMRHQLGRFAVLLVGGGPQEKLLKAQIERLDLGAVIHLVGRVPHSDVVTYYDLCDLCVYPRKKMRLTDLVTPLKPLEAMSRGVPVLASDVGGHKELILSNETGFLFEADNINSLKLSLLKCKTQRRPMEVIFKAQNFVTEERNWKKATQPYEKVFKQVCAD